MCGGCGGIRGKCLTFSLTDILLSRVRGGLGKKGYIHHIHHSGYILSIPYFKPLKKLDFFMVMGN